MSANGKHRLSWISKKNLKQQEWAAEYLRKQGVSMDPMGSYESLVASIDGWRDDSAAREFVRNMKTAWRQKAYRDKLNRHRKQAVTFVISSDAKRLLRGSAKEAGISMNKMLEQLIRDGSAALTRNKDASTAYSGTDGEPNAGPVCPIGSLWGRGDPGPDYFWETCRKDELLRTAEIDRLLTEDELARARERFLSAKRLPDSDQSGV